MTLTELIQQAIAEDIPDGDMTTDGLKLGAVIGNARLIAKEDLILAGREVFEQCVLTLEPEATLHWQFNEGALALDRQVVVWIKGDLTKLLKAERVGLNFLGHLSGIATLTRCYVNETSGTDCKILDTRKTTPLLRGLEKAAVRAGGGHNHRMNLSDAILVKENHIRAAGGMRNAITRVRGRPPRNIEVECTTLEEVQIAVAEKVQRILLDNMNLEQMREARQLIPRSLEIEASGNMTLERIRKVAELGIDYISVGALTHSAPCADFSLLFDWPTETDGRNKP